MEKLPNPARFVSFTKQQLKKYGLILNPDKLKQIRNFPKNELTQLMHAQLDFRVKYWEKRDLTINKAEGVNRGHFEGFEAAAFKYRLDGDKKLLLLLKKKLNYLLANIYKTNSNPLDAGHLLLSFALLYNWLDKELSKDQKAKMKNAVLHYATELYSNTKTPLGYWSGTPLHNVTHSAWIGIGMAGFAFNFDLPEAKYWLNDAFHYFNLVSWLQADDGSMVEGPSYSAFEAELRPWFYLTCKNLLKENLFRENHKGIADFFVQLHKPFGERENHIFPWGDSAKGIFIHSPINLLLGVASVHRSTKIQSLVYQILNQGFTIKTKFEALNLAFYDPKVPFDKSFKRDNDFHFPDLGLISSRNNWDQNATAISFKCGPFQGHKADKYFDGDPGCSHCHADAASFQVFSRKSDVLIDPGYEFLKKTNHHNTVVINGLGQLGEGTKWFEVNHALHYQHCGYILDYKATNQYSYWTADATKTYLPNIQLKKFLRTIIFLKPDIILVYDDLECAEKSQFQWQWHTPLEVEKKVLDQVEFYNSNVQMNVQINGNAPMVSKVIHKNYTDLMHPKWGNCLIVKNKTKAKQIQCLTVISLSNPTEKNNLKFTYKNNTIKIKSENQTYSISLPGKNKLKLAHKKIVP